MFSDNKKTDETTIFDDIGKACLVQDDQKKKVSNRLSDISNGLDVLSHVNNCNNDELDDILKQAQNMLDEDSYELSNDCETDYLSIRNQMIDECSQEKTVHKNISEDFSNLNNLDKLDIIDDDENWDRYLKNIETYADKNNMDLLNSSVYDILTDRDKIIIENRLEEDYSMTKANCDKYDYMIAAFCGSIAGLVDVFFVGMPGSSKLGSWTDKQVDNFVIKTAKTLGYNSNTEENKLTNAIAFLEQKYFVNYDQATSKSVSDLLGINTRNHHIKSLGHCPDIVGLIFSILDQFTGTSHFLDNGRLITYDSKYGKLVGGNFFAKLFSGFCNWMGHLISDMAGASTTRRKGIEHRGAGIPMPLFELFQLIGKGSFKVYEKNDIGRNATDMTFADISVKVFEEGYDARFALAQAIPVMFAEISIRLMWSIKAKFYYKKPWLECIPFGNNAEIRRMLLTGHGVLCIIDGTDATIKSGGQIVLFIMRMNFIAWKRLAFSGLLEIRALYKENTIDLNVLEKDLQKEWTALYDESL